MKTITTITFQAYVEQLRLASKDGYSKLISSSLVNGFYKAELEKGIDTKYLAKLKELSGCSLENSNKLVDSLNPNYKPNEFVVVEPPEEDIQPTTTEGVAVKVTRKRRPKKDS